jgi:hypothetical protein
VGNTSQSYSFSCHFSEYFCHIERIPYYKRNIRSTTFRQNVRLCNFSTLRILFLSCVSLRLPSFTRSPLLSEWLFRNNSRSRDGVCQTQRLLCENKMRWVCQVNYKKAMPVLRFEASTSLPKTTHRIQEINTNFGMAISWKLITKRKRKLEEKTWSGLNVGLLWWRSRTYASHNIQSDRKVTQPIIKHLLIVTFQHNSIEWINTQYRCDYIRGWVKWKP